jgi:DnaJ-class molecular chaperone
MKEVNKRETTIADVTAYRRNEIACVLCNGKGNAILVHADETPIWKNPRPCPVCRGTGQHSTKLIPTQEQIQDMMMNYSSYK